MFGTLHFLILYPFIRKNNITVLTNRMIVVITALCVLWGFATECIQLYVPGRDFDLADGLADTAGIAFSLLIVFRWIKKRTSPQF